MSKLSKKEYFNNIADKRLQRRKRHKYYWNDITRYCNYFIHDEISVIEIGCGNGEMLSRLKGKNKTGIDFSEKMISNAKKNFPELNLHVMAAENITLNEQFDVIIISNLIGFVDDIQLVFDQITKLCHRNTRVIVTYYNYLWEPFLKFSERIGLKLKTPDQNWLSNADIKNLLYLSGFDVYRIINRQILPFSIPLISYLFNKIIARLPVFNHFCINQYLFAKKDNECRDSKNSKFSVSVVIPARNETGNIENAILRLPKMGSYTEIVFVEGNSTDDTWEKIKEIKAKYEKTHDIKIMQQDGKGKGDAVRKGFSSATGDILMILDADLTVPPEDLSKFYDAIASGKGDFINGSRLVYQMEDNAMRFLNVLGNKFFSMAFTWLLDRPFKDTLCGTKVIFRSDYEKLISNRKFFGEFDPFGDFDLIFGAYKLNLKIVEVPIKYKERTYGSTNISRFRHGFILLKMCLFAARKIKFY
ncbi:MAG: glycosyltransferase [Cytophagales bacterium]|nr:glycosyltransferase [Cytophagales bacterium]